MAYAPTHAAQSSFENAGAVRLANFMCIKPVRFLPKEALSRGTCVVIPACVVILRSVGVLGTVYVRDGGCVV